VLWQHGDLSYKLWQQQINIYERIRKMPTSIQTVVCLCARQYGKSVLGCLLATEDCLRNEDIVVMIIGPTIKQARAIVRPRMKLICRDMPQGMIRHVKSEDTWYFHNGSELKLGGFDTNSSDHRGKTLYKVYIEEILESDPDMYLEFLRSDLAPALTHSKHAQIIYMTTLPKIPDHPFCTITVPEAQAENAFFKFTIYDNKKITEAQFNAIVKLCGGMESPDFKREYLCEQIRDATIILAPEFEEKRHVKEFELPEYANIWVGGDMGGVRDKSVFLLMAFDFVRAKVLVLDERHFEPETGSGKMVDEARNMEGEYIHPKSDSASRTRFHFHGRWVDSDGQMRVDFMLQHKYPVALPLKEELETSVNLIRVALCRNEIEIHPRCDLLIRTLRSGTFNENKTDLARTQSLGHMDAFMALVYGYRHAVRKNPYPILGDAQPHTHYIDTTNVPQTKSAAVLRSLFQG
jgi:hypothetical protein